ncbi:glycoside hydrolase family 99-like domain-containing protein [Phocaeicola plebeius]|uniref:glycosyltransferase WbsX family protein n=1 Tax=Phocaeicola plebeius TaxID=310297 RepID=UPI002012EC76|nr:glycoside hydrolase family 99-like domain-containing protein [Phocaeicola plebeius]MCL1612469.1 glycoside hydrolase family 99-like domain-containing protein [Phocaeicola plebeius]
MKARVIAFYLPQYHPIPENDKWWGKGFTEWTNVGKSKPLFRGHYQPRVPADLGYYDLRLPIIREQQAMLAKKAGIEGFMYWHYWFGNKKTLLAEIFDDVLKTGKPDFPFCLGWANHSWTRRTWNSSAQMQKDVDLLIQTYPGEQDIEDHFYNVLPAFKDKRYITVDQKPIFVIYAPFDLPNASEFINKWNKLAKENGIKNGIHFVGLATGWIGNYQKVLDMGFDAIAPSNLWYAESKVKGKYIKLIEHKLRKYVPRIAPLDKYKYKNIIKYLFTDYDKLENAYPSIIPNWDRSPRGGRRAVIYTGSTPELFKQHVQNALKLIEHKQDEHKILFLRSWNEWAEGNYMEPDLKFGHGYLDALEESIKKQF